MEKINEFKRYHPIVNFTYFLFVIGFSIFFMNPLFLAISFICGFAYSILLKGKDAAKTNIIYMLPMMITAAVINPAFNHEGATILKYLPNGNPLTLESVIYGFAAAVMLVNVICWFSCYNEIMTSDKFIYLFGKIIPSLSLILSMTLRFMPRFLHQLKNVSYAQKSIGNDISEGNPIKRAKCGVSILSIMITWSLESSIEIADSMKSRGYGQSGRTAFSIFNFDKRDKLTFICIVILGIYIIAGNIFNWAAFRYFPSFRCDISALGISVFAAYFLLCAIPIMIEYREAKRWKYIKSKI